MTTFAIILVLGSVWLAWASRGEGLGVVLGVLVGGLALAGLLAGGAHP